MDSRLLLSVTLVGATSLGGVATVRAAKATAVAVPLVVSVDDTSTNRIRSDGSFGGEYTDGQENVFAQLLANTNGNFVFDTNDQPGRDGGRRLVLDFNGQPTPFASTLPLYVDIFIGTLATEPGLLDDNLQTMHQGDDLQRRTRMAWVDGNLQYSLRWDGPDNGHSFLNVHCDDDDTAVKPRCTEWTVTPLGVAGLYSIPTKGKVVDTHYPGLFNMPFVMKLRKK